VDFLHRIGRTGRAGRAGLVTSMFTQDRSDLVEAVREAVDAQEPVVREIKVIIDTSAQLYKGQNSYGQFRVHYVQSLWVSICNL
jgi:superfamily II DNA/RNA helicase